MYTPKFFRIINKFVHKTIKNTNCHLYKIKEIHFRVLSLEKNIRQFCLEVLSRALNSNEL